MRLRSGFWWIIHTVALEIEYTHVQFSNSECKPRLSVLRCWVVPSVWLKVVKRYCISVWWALEVLMGHKIFYKSAWKTHDFKIFMMSSKQLLYTTDYNSRPMEIMLYMSSLDISPNLEGNTVNHIIPKACQWVKRHSKTGCRSEYVCECVSAWDPVILDWCPIHGVKNLTWNLKLFYIYLEFWCNILNLDIK